MQTYLEHHGVKGMKWGVRKQKPPVKKNDRFEKANIEGRLAYVKKESSAGAKDRKSEIKDIKYAYKDMNKLSKQYVRDMEEMAKKLHSTKLSSIDFDKVHREFTKQEKWFRYDEKIEAHLGDIARIYDRYYKG